MKHSWFVNTLLCLFLRTLAKQATAALLCTGQQTEPGHKKPKASIAQAGKVMADSDLSKSWLGSCH